MNPTVYQFIESLGIIKDLNEFLKENPEVVNGDPEFEMEVIEQIALVLKGRFTEDEMVDITSFHTSSSGIAWLTKNSEMADDIDKLFKAHAVAKLSQQLFGELNLLPETKDEEDTVN